MTSEVLKKADFSFIRYAQCWEDADILLEALNVQPGGIYLSIASAGDNALAMLSKGPERVIAVDLNPAQIACVELRASAYRELSHAEMLEFMGSKPSRRRRSLYKRCRKLLPPNIRRFWDQKVNDIELGIGHIGKLEKYFCLFRKRILPLIQTQAHIKRLFDLEDCNEREHFYEATWNNLRWQTIFRIFLSRFVIGRLGRDPALFQYVNGSVAERLLQRTRKGLTVLNPAENPYLQWIFFGEHKTALPCALRAENYHKIRENIDRLECRVQSVEDFLDSPAAPTIDGFNLSDIFEYMSLENYHRLLQKIIDTGHPGARLAYWNLLVSRRRPVFLADRVSSLIELSRKLHARDKTFFYSDFLVEELL